jgi:hypothetical protein
MREAAKPGCFFPSNEEREKTRICVKMMKKA